MYFNKDLDLPIVSETNNDIYPNLQPPAKNTFLNTMGDTTYDAWTVVFNTEDCFLELGLIMKKV